MMISGGVQRLLLGLPHVSCLTLHSFVLLLSSEHGILLGRCNSVLGALLFAFRIGAF